ncbi:MAG: lysylphosphatidylglycerol synthase transmembrane domain-containing protein [Planctomycetota bacterium]
MTIGKFVLPALIIAWLLWRIEPEQWEQLRNQPKNYGLLVLAMVVALVAMSISFARWCLLVRCQGIPLGLMEAFRLGAIGFSLSFISPGSVGGDLFKAVFLARQYPGKKMAAAASVVVDRGCGLYGLLLLVSMAMLFRRGQGQMATSGTPGETQSGQLISIDGIATFTIISVALGTLVLAVLILGGKLIDQIINRLSTVPVMGKLITAIGPPLRSFHDHPVAFGCAVLMSVGVQASLVLSMTFISRGLFSDPPTTLEHFIIVPAAMLASALPITPAGTGVLEAAVDQLYNVVPAKPTTASGVLVALTFELVKIVVAAIGTFFYWTSGKDVRATMEEAEAESVDR